MRNALSGYGMLRGLINMVLLAMALLLVGCSSTAQSSSAAAEASSSPPGTATSTIAPIRHYKASRSELADMRNRWGVAIALVATSADNLHGVFKTLFANPDEARDYPILVEAPEGDAAADELPRSWETVRALTREVANNVATGRRDLKSWMDGAELDDTLKSTLTIDDSRVVDSMCNALTEAREYYGAAGGYPNDLSFVLISDKGDRPCQNVAMSRPYDTTVKRHAIVTIAQSTNEMPEANSEEALLQDNAGFVVPAGTSVRVIGHRYIDNIESTMCQIHGGGGTGWLPCTWLSRAPRANDV